MKQIIKTLKHSDLPERLREIPQPPKKLYHEGALPNWNKKFLCVVGARKYTPYGKEVCEQLIAGLRGYPIIIVSGLALGIDGIAHRAALANKIHTIAFPGSGLNKEVLYPASNYNLANDILTAGGALFSELEHNTRAADWTFPQRNRLMAGISHATLIIEAESKSGTLITARLATEYNREVCAVPGPIFSKNSEGPHLLLRLGATPITKTEDLLQVLGFATESSRPPALASYADCTDEEKKIIEYLRASMPRDELVRLTGKSASEVNTMITLLEIKGVIKETLGELRLV